MSKPQRSRKCPAPADAPANPSTQPSAPIQLNEKEQEVFTILNENKNISNILSNLRTKKQKTDLKAYNNKLNKFGKDIVEGVLKKCPDLQKKAMIGAERISALRERMTQEQRKNDWKLCINFLMSSS